MDLVMQMERIESLQEQIQYVLQDDSLDNLEAMTAELGSRVNTVLGALQDGVPSPAHMPDVLSATLLRHMQLISLVQRKLQLTGTQRSKAHAARQAVTQYAVTPAQTESRCMPDTDVYG